MSDVQISHLRCEYLVNPLGIDELLPRLSWLLDSTRRGQRQTAYQILVASSPEKLAGDEADLWDSGRVQSDQSIHVVYAGKPLTAGQRCWWKVRLWDRNGQPSAYSQPAWWEMGRLRPEEWLAGWISLAGYDTLTLQPSPYFRTTLAVTRPVKQARIYATAKGVYELHLNGQRVGEAIFAPGWTDYDRRFQYQTYDVTSLLQPGDNILGAVLGPGWYGGYIGFQKEFKHYGARPQLLLQLHLDYTDGTSQSFASGPDWKASTGPIIYSDMLMGESYDARLELAGWAKPGYDDSAWLPVHVEPLNSTLLAADRAEPVRITQEISPVAITRRADQTYIVDMGQNMVGWVRLKVTGEAGQVVRLRFAEMLDETGALYRENLRSAEQTDTYVLKGGQPEYFSPHFTFHGFRYVEISGYPGQLTAEAITGQVIHSATPPVGRFTCSNPLVNQLQHNIEWGQRGNFLSIPTDCPQRDERMGWLGDAQIFIRTATYNMDVAAFFTKWLADLADAQSSAGGYPNVAPRVVSLADGAPGWADAGVIIPWTMYRVYGDTRLIKRYWGHMSRWMEYLRQANPGLLRAGRLTDNYGDWLAVAEETAKDVLATAYFAYDAALMAEMAAAIDRPAEARQYQTLAAAIQNAFNAAYVSPDGRIKGETQTAYVLALHMNLLPAELRPAAAAHLVANIQAKGWHLSTGFIGVGYLCPVLTAAGYPDVAYRLLTNETFPSWGYSIKQGATTIWERWDGWTEDKGFQDKRMNSFNHYSLGSVGQWLYQTVAGIDAAEPGFKHILIRPEPGGGLTSAQAEYTSMYGQIRSAWHLEDGRFTLHLTIPANTTATVFIPAPTLDRVDIDGQPVQAAPGVKFLEGNAGKVKFAVEAGSYIFSTRV